MVSMAIVVLPVWRSPRISAEGLRDRRPAGLPRDEAAELVDVVGRARREQRHAERVLPLLRVVLAAEDRGVGERVAEHHPFGEVALLRRLAREEGGEHRVTREQHAGHPRALQLRDDEAGVFLRGRDVEAVRHPGRRSHAVRRQASGEAVDAGAERARVVVVVHDAERPPFAGELVARVLRLALGQLRADERGPVLARLLG
jgi:hypothetical protein